MAANIAIECADRSVRWYLTPGQTSRYEISVINQSGDESIECTMALDDPPAGGSFEPASFALRPRERKMVSLTFAEETQVPRDQRALISVRDSEGIVIASLERGLISAGGTDCTVSLSWKEPIVDGDEVRGFVISCAIKSLSASPGMFALQSTPHPALEFVDVAPIKLQPGQTATVAIPILWKRTHKDPDGLDHPRVIEIGVAVSQGRRTGRLSWDAIESKLAALKPAVAPTPPPVAAAPPEPAIRPTETTANPDAAPVNADAAMQADTAPSPPSTLNATEIGQGDAARTPANGVAPSPAASDAPAPSEPAAMGDEALMSLLVGKPVSPPPGWRSPGRDAPDAEEAPPPSIFAKTPPSVTAKKPAPTGQAPELPPYLPPPPPPPKAPPPPAQARDAVPPAARPQMPVRSQPAASADAVPPAARPQMPAFAGAIDADAAGGTQEPEAFESSVVGPPPSRSRTIAIEKEHTKSARRAAEIATMPSMLEGRLPALVMGGTALIAIALVAFFLLRPYAPSTAPQATPAATIPPPVVLENVTPPLRPKAVKPNARTATSPVPSIAASAAARVATQATQRATQTSPPAPAVRPAVHSPASVAMAPKPTRAPAPKPHRQRLNPAAVVAIQGILARYGPAGHAVRVLWGASSQASARVQLSDDRGGVLSQTDVTGQRQNALLYVPRSYHGSVFVQVVSIGFQGERVTQSTSLPPFSH